MRHLGKMPHNSCLSHAQFRSTIKVGPAQARTFAQWLISPEDCVLPDHHKGTAFS